MRKIIKKGVVLAMLGVAMAAQAATVTLNAGVPQTVQLKDATTGGTITVSVPKAGGSHLEFSNGTNVMFGVVHSRPSGILAYLNLFRPEYSADQNGLISEVKVTYGSRTKTTEAGALYWDTGLASMSIDQASGRILSIGVAGNLKIDVECANGLWDGGVLTIGNLRFDFVRQVLVGDMSASGSPYVCDGGPSYSWRSIDLFSFTVTSGGLSIPVGALAAKDDFQVQNAGFKLARSSKVIGADVTHPITLQNLRWTPQSLNLFKVGVGMPAGSSFEPGLLEYTSTSEGVARVRITNRFSVTTP
jgi:hypothetical protein